MLTDRQYKVYCDILKSELQPATGCTEPIALALCAAKAAEALGEMPETVTVEVSGNILKNVKSVTVPNTNGLKGIRAAVAAGFVAGCPERGLQVISGLSDAQIAAISRFLSDVPILVRLLSSDDLLDMIVTAGSAAHTATVRLDHTHDHIAYVTLDGRYLYRDTAERTKEAQLDYGLLNISDIFDFASGATLDDIAPLLQRQLECNAAICREGLKGRWGAAVGRTLLMNADRVKDRACAFAAAGSDARMGGCDMPVVINSGSGNQGLTVSMPVYVYARALKAPEEDLLRALALSNLCAIHIKHAIGRLSAFCGAVTAGSAAGAGIAYLQTKDLDTVAHTIVNSLAIISGMICDGAKPSCAAKIAAAVNAGILGLELYQNGQQFYGGEGIISKGIENTIRNIGILGRDGMRETDAKILEIMAQA